MIIKSFLAISAASLMLLACKTNTNDNMSTLNLIKEWDKTFPKSELVNHSKVTFHNRYGIELAADMYVPKNAEGKLPAIAVSGPFGAVKEQSSGLYAQHMAERGFLTIAFDPSFTGESFPPASWLIRTASASSAFAASAVWRSTPLRLTRASRLR